MSELHNNTPWLNASEDAAWRAYLKGVAQFTNELNRRLEVAANLSLSEYEILVRLSENPNQEMRMSDLADSVYQTRSRLTHTVRRLEQRHMVTREACAEDKRGVNCRLTEAGLQLIVKLAPQHVRDVRELLIDAVDPGDLEAFHRVMETMAARSEAEQAPARQQPQPQAHPATHPQAQAQPTQA